MKKKLTKSVIRDYADILYSDALSTCMEAHSVEDHLNPRKLAALKERAAVKKAIANELYNILDAEL